MKSSFGSISSTTVRPVDLIPRFAEELRSLATYVDDDRKTVLVANEDHVKLADEADNLEDYDSENAGYVLEELVDALREYAPAYGYFGAHPGDGADYGFWLYEDWLQMAKDNDALIVDDTSEVPADYTGEVVHINDHGNATLYAAQNGELTEVWSVV